MKMRGMKSRRKTSVRKKKTDDDMLNLPKSLHEEDMSSIDEMMNMTLTRSP